MTNKHPPILQLFNISIQRGNFTLCNGINLTLNAGDICHLIGANGSGKTTLLMQLASILPIQPVYDTPHDDYDLSDNETHKHNKISKVAFMGVDKLPIQPVYVSHQPSINANLTVSQNLTFLLNLYGITPTKQMLNEALKWVELTGYEHIKCHELSAGQTRRVNLARLQIMQTEHTKLWLLDEPFTALDSTMVTKLKTIIKAFAHSGGTVLITSHQPINIQTKVLDLSSHKVSY